MLRLLLISLLLLSGLGLTACEQGPAERAGEQIDETTEDVGEAAEDAAEEND